MQSDALQLTPAPQPDQCAHVATWLLGRIEALSPDYLAACKARRDVIAARAAERRAAEAQQQQERAA